MEDSEITALQEEVQSYLDRKEYATCIQRIEERLKRTNDSASQTTLLLAKYKCASEMGDLAMAENAAFAIDLERCHQRGEIM